MTEVEEQNAKELDKYVYVPYVTSCVTGLGCQKFLKAKGIFAIKTHSELPPLSKYNYFKM